MLCFVFDGVGLLYSKPKIIRISSRTEIYLHSGALPVETAPDGTVFKKINSHTSLKTMAPPTGKQKGY